MMHVEALQWTSCIFTRRLRASCHQLYELGDATTNGDAAQVPCLGSFAGCPACPAA